MRNYSDIGLNNRLRKKGSPAEKKKRIDSSEFEADYQVSTGAITVSKLNVVEFIRLSALGTALGTFSTSQSLNLTSTLTYLSPYSTKKIFGNINVSIYQGAGTSTATQIYPIAGSSVTNGRYDVQSSYDLTGWDEIKSRWRGRIIDTNGTSSQVITFATKWWHCDTRSRGT